jgi:hypothetical protein
VSGWVLFRAEGLRAGLKYALSMAGMRGNPLICANAVGLFRDYRVFLLCAILCSTPVFGVIKTRIGKTKLRYGTAVLSIVFYLFIFLWSVSFIVLGAHNPFIYFNF